MQSQQIPQLPADKAQDQSMQVNPNKQSLRPKSNHFSISSQNFNSVQSSQNLEKGERLHQTP